MRQYVPIKRERVLRGWSQTKVAQEIGTLPRNISRWERGLHAPSPYFREKLCLLFSKDAVTLGLAEPYDTSNPEKEMQESKGKPQVSPCLRDPLLPENVSGTKFLVGREVLLQQLIQWVSITQKSSTFFALNGLPGVGKTVLALALTQQEDIQKQFAQGILWAGLGPHAQVKEHLSRWGVLLGIKAKERKNLQKIEAWNKALRLVIGERRLLIVIDDVWKIEDVLALQVGGPNCVYLVTTRFPLLGLQVAGKERTFTIPELRQEDGLILLKYFAPNVVKQELALCRQLIQQVGVLPLALTLMGRHLQTESVLNQPPRIQKALARLQNGEQRLNISFPRSLGDIHPNLSTDTLLSLTAVIAVSEQLLDERTRKCLYALAVLPTKPASFSEGVATTVMQQPVEVLDVLYSVGLVESAGTGRYMLHQTIASYAWAKNSDEQTHLRLLEYSTVFAKTYQKDYTLLETERDVILLALQFAHSSGLSHKLIQLILAFVPFLISRGLYTIAETYLLASWKVANEQEKIHLAGAVGDVLIRMGNYEQAEECLYKGLYLAQVQDDAGQEQIIYISMFLGVLMEKRGRYRQSMLYYQNALSAARDRSLREIQCDILYNMGGLLEKWGEYEQAKIALREAFILARQTENVEQTSCIIGNLGSIAAKCGDYKQAQNHYQEALRLAQKIGCKGQICSLFASLGTVTIQQGNDERAQMYSQEALFLARQMNYSECAIVPLCTLASLAVRQENSKQAEIYLSEALALAYQMGNRWYICATLLEWGEMHLKLGLVEEASSNFQEALTYVSEDDQQFNASLCYRIACVYALKGNITEARSQGQSSLMLFEKLGHTQMSDVKVWLDSLV